MTHPLANLRRYGGKPINKQAENFLSYKKKGQRKRTGDSNSQKKQCPICGQYKFGLTAHIAALHPQAQGSSTKPVANKTRPNLCPICDGSFPKISLHLAVTHSSCGIKCPACLQEGIFPLGAIKKCDACQTELTISNAGIVVCTSNQHSKQTEAEQCPFCSISKERILTEDQFFTALSDGFPIVEGHTLVVPKKHVQSVFDLSSEEQDHLWRFIAAVRERLKQEFNVAAFNFGINDGAVAGQTVPHAHVHIIPRRDGDVDDPRGGIRWIIPAKAKYW